MTWPNIVIIRVGWKFRVILKLWRVDVARIGRHTPDAAITPTAIISLHSDGFRNSYDHSDADPSTFLWNLLRRVGHNRFCLQDKKGALFLLFGAIRSKQSSELVNMFSQSRQLIFTKCQVLSSTFSHPTHLSPGSIGFVSGRRFYTQSAVASHARNVHRPCLGKRLANPTTSTRRGWLWH